MKRAPGGTTATITGLVRKGELTAKNSETENLRPVTENDLAKVGVHLLGATMFACERCGRRKKWHCKPAVKR